jgi:hypothetical protein
MFIQALSKQRILKVMKAPVHSDSDRHEDRHEVTGLAGIPTQTGARTLCRHCAAPAPERLVRVVGAWSVIDGVAKWDCDSCARARLQEIEAGTDAPHSTG